MSSPGGSAANLATAFTSIRRAVFRPPKFQLDFASVRDQNSVRHSRFVRWRRSHRRPFADSRRNPAAIRLNEFREATKMTLRIRLAILFALLGIPSLASAQQSITCASGPSGRRVYCAADTRGGVTLVSPVRPGLRCRQGVQWGFDANGIWVQDGCAASFRVSPYRGGPWWWDSGPGVRPAPWRGTGACFYKRVQFDGPYFCLSRGDRIDRLPPRLQRRD
jgi:hypothetical protein